ncbi:hypothetical protein PALB_32970 [Pseudoalteromonas luteoviolacea B = ATCC 29581]|nr:hypothetical protein PALB_32970 [Pseudoalteromonas luteoviolacea B = ATCC 29581]
MTYLFSAEQSLTDIIRYLDTKEYAYCIEEQACTVKLKVERVRV